MCFPVLCYHFSIIPRVDKTSISRDSLAPGTYHPAQRFPLVEYANSEFTNSFGYIDEPSLNGQQPHYVPVDTSNGFWEFPSPTITIAGTQHARPGRTAIVDTGTTLVLIDDDICAKIYDAIPGSRYDNSQPGYVFPTNISASALPVISFGVGDREFAINVADLPFAPTGFADANGGESFGGIQSRGTLGFDVFGDTWLKGVYAIFDQGNKRFGVVQRKF